MDDKERYLGLSCACVVCVLGAASTPPLNPLKSLLGESGRLADSRVLPCLCTLIPLLHMP